MFDPDAVREIYLAFTVGILGLLVNPVFMQPDAILLGDKSSKPSISGSKPKACFGVIGHPHPSSAQTGIERNDAVSPVVEIECVSPSLGKPTGMIVGEPILGFGRLGLNLKTWNE